MGLSPEESRALFGEPGGSPAPRRPSPLVAVIVVGVAFAGLAVMMFLRAERSLAERDEARRENESLTGRVVGLETEVAALRGAIDQAEREVVARDQRLAEAAEALASKSREADGLGRALEASVVAGDAFAAAYLRSSAPAIGGRRGSVALELLAADPATGDTPLAVLASSLPRDKAIAVVLATVESLSNEAPFSTVGEANAALVLAGGLVADARTAFPREGPDAVGSQASLLDDALVAAARLAWIVHALDFTDLEAREGLRADARRLAQEALLLRRAEGGRGVAEALTVLADVAAEEGDLREAASHLEDARRELADGGTVPEQATVETDLAAIRFALGDRDEALARLADLVKTLDARRPGADEAERAARLGAHQLRMRLLDASEARTLDEAGWMEARLALARAAVDAGRASVAAGMLPEVLAFYSRDDSRFAERVETSLVLAAALDRLGARTAALELLGRARFADDLRVLGEGHPLAVEHAALAGRLRLR